jgi:hypothetical protein
MSVKKVFPVKTIQYDITIPPGKDQPVVIKQHYQFIWGKTTKTEHTSEYNIYTDIPIDAVNLFKHLIVIKYPTLKFGWLVPQYRVVPQQITHHKTYVKVIPLDRFYDKDHYTYLAEK